MPKASAAISSRSPPTRGNFSSASKSPMWTKSPASLRPLPSSRKTPRAIRARPWPRPRRFTIICACSSRARTHLLHQLRPTKSAKTPSTKSPRASWRSPQGRRFYVLVRARTDAARSGGEEIRASSAQKSSPSASAEAIQQALADLQRRGFNRLYQDGRVHEFSSPETLLDIDFSQARLRACGPLGDRSRHAFASGRFHRDLLSRRPRRSDPGISYAGRRRRGAAERLIFNERFECKKCGTLYQEPEPRLFSFNNPYGACPRCQGFGNTIDFDLDRVIPDRGKSLDEGAIEPWTKPRYRALLAGAEEFRARPKAFRSTCRFATSPPRSATLIVEGDQKADYRRERLLRLARTQKIQAARARISEPLSRLRHLSRMQWHAAAAGSPRGSRLGQIDHRSLRDDGRRGAAVLSTAWN